MRRHYLDNVRWATVLLVVVYHVFYMFNAAGVPGGVGNFSGVQYQDALLYFVYPWFMVLLFVVAGMSARYALEKKTIREFISSRTVKLLVPSTLGLLVFQWLVGFLNVKIGGGLEHMAEVPAPILYLIFAVSGIGPLWFAQMLWLFSLVLALSRRLDRDDRLWALCGKASPVVLIPLFLLLWGASQIGNVPVLTFYRFGIYAAAFLTGYFVLSHDAMQEHLAKARLPLLAAALVMGCAYVAYYFGQDYTAGACLQSLFTNLYAWTATLAALGCAKAWFDGTTPFAAYMSRASFGVYVLHYFFALCACWVLKTYTSLPAALIYILALTAALGGALGCWELFRRVPFVRFTVLGIKKRKREAASR